MEKIQIGTQEALYDILSIRPMSPNVMQVVFSSAVPATYGDITIYTTGDYEADTITGYDTVFRDEGQTVYLSNDGSVYTAPETPEGPDIPLDPYVPTLEDQQAYKLREMSAACERIIYSGVNIGSEHYSLTEHDQLNLFGKQAQIATGVTQLEYHANGQPCRYYSPEEMQVIIQAAMWHVSYHTTYCNALNMWITGAETTEEVLAIFYGAEVPERYQSDVLKAYLLQIANMAEEDGA